MSYFCDCNPPNPTVAGRYCLTCHFTIAPVELSATPLDGDAPRATDGEATTSPADPSTDAFSDDELDRVAALVRKHTSH